MSVHEALATVGSIWSVHVILLSNVTLRYLTLCTKGMSRPFGCTIRDSKSSGEMDHPSFSFH